MSDVQLTELLDEAVGGDTTAAQRLMPLVYDELRALAQSYLARERPDHTLQATALVHEAFLRLVGQKDAKWKGPRPFFRRGRPGDSPHPGGSRTRQAAGQTRRRLAAADAG